MKFLKIILLLFILISPSNANTIYNLIKIPNLEIYNNKSINGIKYLRANKPFQVGVRNNNVTCFNSNIQTIDEKFDKAIDMINSCLSKVVILGIGKSGHIGKKIAATMSSLGTPAFFVHMCEGIHGDLGMISADDLCIIFSYSGETEEILPTIQSIRQLVLR